MAVKHAFTNPKADGPDTTRARPSDWNADHIVADDSFTIAKTSGLQTALDAKATAASVTDHVADTTSVHGITDAAGNLDVTKVPDASLTIAKTSGLQTALDAKQPTIADGDLTIAKTSGLQTALDAKATAASVTDHVADTTSVHGITNADGFIEKTGTAASDFPSLSAEFLDAANWTLGAGWSGDFATGFAHTGGGGTATLAHDHAAVVNSICHITYTVTGRTAGSFTLAFGGVTSAAITATGNQGPQATTTEPLVITPTTDFNGTIVVSIKSITGASTPMLTLKDSGGTTRVEIRAGRTESLAVGHTAGRSNTTGTLTAVGHEAGLLNTTGLITAVGYFAGFSNTTGTITAVGHAAGRFLSNGTTGNATASGGTYIGQDTRAGAAGAANETVIGYLAIGGGSNTVRLGNTSVANWLPGATNVCYLGNATTAFKGAYFSDGTDEWLMTVNTSGQPVFTKQA